MRLLNNMMSALRRGTGLGMPVTPGSLPGTGELSRSVSVAEQMLGGVATVHPFPTIQTASSPAPASHAGPVAAPADAGRQHRSFADAPPTVQAQSRSGAPVLRPGQQFAQWRNPFIRHAMPVILQLHRLRDEGSLQQPQARVHLAMELRHMREQLSREGLAWELVNDSSYLMCTFLDEVVNEDARLQSLRPYEGDRSLLVEFHGDAWGGEDAFADLERLMAQEAPPRDALALYELVLSLGWVGRYSVLDRGEVLLQDLRSRLHALVWQHQTPDPLGTALPQAAPAPVRWLSAGRLALILLALALVAWLVAHLLLDAKGRPLREALAAWEPPARKVNLAESLPQPLPSLISEGWLTAYKHPDGWLLVFRSDGAFDVGQARFRTEFMNNIERLGLALAPWPGDLEVVGHTDINPIATGRFPSNQELSQARADTVAQELRQTAVQGGSRAPANAVSRQITASGRGAEQPLDPSGSASALARNRRVDVFWKVTPKPGAPATSPGGQPELPPGIVPPSDGPGAGLRERVSP